MGVWKGFYLWGLKCSRSGGTYKNGPNGITITTNQLLSAGKIFSAPTEGKSSNYKLIKSVTAFSIELIIVSIWM